MSALEIPVVFSVAHPAWSWCSHQVDTKPTPAKIWVCRSGSPRLSSLPSRFSGLPDSLISKRHHFTQKGIFTPEATLSFSAGLALSREVRQEAFRETEERFGTDMHTVPTHTARPRSSPSAIEAGPSKSLHRYCRNLLNSAVTVAKG